LAFSGREYAKRPVKLNLSELIGAPVGSVSRAVTRPHVEVHAVLASRKLVSPTIRAFIDTARDEFLNFRGVGSATNSG